MAEVQIGLQEEDFEDGEFHSQEEASFSAEEHMQREVDAVINIMADRLVVAVLDKDLKDKEVEVQHFVDDIPLEQAEGHHNLYIQMAVILRYDS